jgi:hypothetical protein
LVLSSPGLTIRGEHHGVFFGPELSAADPSEGPQLTVDQMFVIAEGTDDIRITGLRIRGPSRQTDQGHPSARCIGTWEANARNIVDHDDISDFPNNGVFVQSHDVPPPADAGAGTLDPTTTCDHSSSDPQRRATTAFVARNFIHHNRMEEAGYGVESYRGAYPFVYGNTFVSNRHSIAAGFGTAHTAWRAWSNLVLSDAPLQHGLFHTHDFDMHGMGTNGFGGLGGDYVDIYQNTFFGTNRHNFELRGTPCDYAEYHDNISLESQGDAINWNTCADICFGATAGLASQLRVSHHPNQFNHSNPTAKLGVGDFDADGYDDLFLATGAAFYYSQGGMTAWRFLSAQRDTIDLLRFGDFDGDGRTDVFAIHGGQFVVSWGGASDWEIINADPTGGQLLLLPSAVIAMATGDFYGDTRSDIFYADGTNWYVWDAGQGAQTFVQTSSFRTPDLRFGDFDADGKTDVFGVGNVNWQVSYAPTSGSGLFSSWTPLQKKLTNTADGLLVGVFDDLGGADLVKPCDDPGDCAWEISPGGAGAWQKITQRNWGTTTSFVAAGHFLANRATDLITWNGIFVPSGCTDCTSCDCSGSVEDTCGSIGLFTQHCISQGGTTAVQHYSTQDMR